MSEPVWSLSVDLQAKTAIFQSGLADAARAARGSFTEIKEGAAEAGRETGYSMMEARHGVMLLGEEFGVHLPRALTSFIASLGPIGSAMETAFPFLAIAVGATLLLEHFAKLKQAGQELTESQANFAHVTAKVLNGLNDKLLEAGKRADELRGDHLAALEKELQLLDHASLRDLETAFDELSQSADKTFERLKTSWYQFGTGSAGAKASLEKFREEYQALIDAGKGDDATALLDAKVEREEHILFLQKQQRDSQAVSGAGGHQGDYAKYEAAKLELQKLGVGITKQEIDAQEELVDILRTQEKAETAIQAARDQSKANARTTTANTMAEESDRAAREQAQVERQAVEASEKLWEQHYHEAVSQLQESEKLQIDATKQGSMARLAAIDQAIKEENSKGLQETEFYKSLLQQRVNLQTEMQNEQGKLAAAAGKESAENSFRMGQLQIAADREAGQSRLQQALMTGNDRLALERKLEEEEYSNQQEEFAKERAALDQSSEEYFLKKQQLDDKEEQLEKQHQNRLQQIQDQEQAQEYSNLSAAQAKMVNLYAQGFSKVIMGKESFGKMMQQIDSEIASSMLQHAIMSMMALDMTKEKEAAAAARKAFLAGEQTLPGVAGVVLGGALAAAAFASQMAFGAEGGEVPGVALGDVVPTMLEPGEGVLSKANMERLREATANAESGGGQHVHIHHNPTYHVQVLDGDGMRAVLQKHGEQLTQHVENHFRRLNK